MLLGCIYLHPSSIFLCLQSQKKPDAAAYLPAALGIPSYFSFRARL